MKKRIFFVILGLVVVIAILAGVKGLQIRAMINKGKAFVPPPETVSSAVVRSDSWISDLTAVGSLTAVQGVTVSADLVGKVTTIAFVPGSPVRKGALLVQQDISSEEAQLPGAVAQTKQARAELERSAKMVAENIISQADYDKAESAFKQAQAQVNSIRATINKKTIRAPFSGRLGIRQVNLGQLLREGDPVVTLQTLSPIFVDFSLPQQELARLYSGQPVRVTCDAVPGQTVEGKITAINPLVDSETRAVKIQATVINRSEKLRPGMFVTVAVGLPARRKVLTIPATAVLYASYSDSVFVIEKDKGAKAYKLRQQFVRLGEKHGDFVAVTSGLKEGESVVSTGVFKLRNGQSAVIDNKLAPNFQQSPRPENN